MTIFNSHVKLPEGIYPSESANGRQRKIDRPGHQWKPKISRRGLGVVEWQPGDQLSTFWKNGHDELIGG